MFLPRSRISSGEDKLFLDSEGFRPRFGKHASPAQLTIGLGLRVSLAIPVYQSATAPSGWK